MCNVLYSIVAINTSLFSICLIWILSRIVLLLAILCVCYIYFSDSVVATPIFALITRAPY